MTKGLPFWCDQASPSPYPALEDDMRVDVAIVGGGILGLHLAWRLRDTGLRVALFEARRIGFQATGRSTAKVTSQHGLKYDRLIRDLGAERARIYAQENEKAVRDIASLARLIEGRADLEQKDAYIFAADKDQAEQLEVECKAAAQLGINAEIVSNVPLPFSAPALLRFPGQYQFDPCRYLMGLAKLVSDKIALFEQSRVLEIEYGSPSCLSINGRVVKAGRIVLATQIPIVNDGFFFTKSFPFGHPVAAAPLPGNPRPEGMFISAGAPTRSFRTARRDGQDWLIAAGKEFKLGDAEQQRDAIADLRAWLLDCFGIQALSHLWTNEDFRPMDGLAFVGARPRRSPICWSPPASKPGG